MGTSSDQRCENGVMDGTDSGMRLRLADLLGGLSMVADMGFGLPAGQAMRSCLVSTAGARRLDLPESEVADAFYAALLMHIGCVSMSYETSVLFGNELTLTRAVAMTNLGDPEDYAATLIPQATQGARGLGTRSARHGDHHERAIVRSSLRHGQRRGRSADRTPSGSAGALSDPCQLRCDGGAGP